MRPAGRGPKLAAVLWLLATIAGFYMAAEPDYARGISVDSPARGLYYAFGAIFVARLGLDMLLAYRLGFYPTRWLLPLSALMLAWAFAVGTVDIVRASRDGASDVGAITIQTLGGVVAALVACLATFAARSSLPGARCPHCGHYLPMSAWRSCPNCGVAFSSPRYRA